MTKFLNDLRFGEANVCTYAHAPPIFVNPSHSQ